MEFQKMAPFYSLTSLETDFTWFREFGCQIEKDTADLYPYGDTYHKHISLPMKLNSSVRLGNIPRSNCVFIRWPQLIFALSLIREPSDQWRRQEKFSGGSRLWPASYGVRGLSPSDAGEFSKICKNISYENCKKCSIFAYFAKKFQNPALNFRMFGWKTQLVGEILRNSRKFLMEIQ